MIGLIPRRLRWMAVGAGVSYLSKWKAEQSVDRATEKLQEQLPEPLARVAHALPAEIIRSAGTVVAVGSAVRKSASLVRTTANTTASATGTAISASRTASGAVKAAGESLRAQRQNLGERVADAAGDLRIQSELDRRELKAAYVRHTEGDGPGLEARLDLRSIDDEPIPETPDPVSAGRRRFRPALPSPPVNRVQRSYRRSTKPWDR